MQIEGTERVWLIGVKRQGSLNRLFLISQSLIVRKDNILGGQPTFGACLADLDKYDWLITATDRTVKLRGWKTEDP
jgi:hypothetical protein